MRNVVIATVLALAACGTAADQPAGPTDWAGKPLDTTVGGTIKGITFTVRVPAGMDPLDDGDPDGESRSWRGHGVGSGAEYPQVRVSYVEYPERSLERYVEMQGPGERAELVRKEEVDGGFLIAFRTRRGELVGAQVLRSRGRHTLECTAFQGTEKGTIHRIDKAVDWMARVCNTLEIKAPS